MSTFSFQKAIVNADGRTVEAYFTISPIPANQSGPDWLPAIEDGQYATVSNGATLKCEGAFSNSSPYPSVLWFEQVPYPMGTLNTNPNATPIWYVAYIIEDNVGNVIGYSEVVGTTIYPNYAPGIQSLGGMTQTQNYIAKIYAGWSTSQMYLYRTWTFVNSPPVAGWIDITGSYSGQPTDQFTIAFSGTPATLYTLTNSSPLSITANSTVTATLSIPGQNATYPALANLATFNKDSNSPQQWIYVDLHNITFPQANYGDLTFTITNAYTIGPMPTVSNTAPPFMPTTVIGTSKTYSFLFTQYQIQNAKGTHASAPTVDLSTLSFTPTSDLTVTLTNESSPTYTATSTGPFTSATPFVGNFVGGPVAGTYTLTIKNNSGAVTGTIGAVTLTLSGTFQMAITTPGNGGTFVTPSGLTYGQSISTAMGHTIVPGTYTLSITNAGSQTGTLNSWSVTPILQSAPLSAFNNGVANPFHALTYSISGPGIPGGSPVTGVIQDYNYTGKSQVISVVNGLSVQITATLMSGPFQGTPVPTGPYGTLVPTSLTFTASPAAQGYGQGYNTILLGVNFDRAVWQDSSPAGLYPTLSQILTWRAVLYVETLTNIITFGSSVTINLPAGLLQDINGNTTPAVSSGAVTNNSLVDSTGFMDESIVNNATIKLYVAANGQDSPNTYSQALNNINKPFLTPKYAFSQLQANNTGAGGNTPVYAAILLRRGDTLVDSGLSVKNSGISITQPLVISNYWDNSGVDPATRPIYTCNSAQNISNAGPPTVLSNFYIDGINLQPNAANYNNAGSGGTNTGLISFLLPGANYFFSDCYFAGSPLPFSFQGTVSPPMTPVTGVTDFIRNIVINRCIILDAQFTGSSHSQGIYCDYGEPLITNCFFNNVGFQDSTFTYGSIFSHAMYTQITGLPVRVINSFVVSAGCNGIEGRTNCMLAYTLLSETANVGFVSLSGGLNKCIVEKTTDRYTTAHVLATNANGWIFNIVLLSSGNWCAPVNFMFGENCIFANSNGTTGAGNTMPCYNLQLDSFASIGCGRVRHNTAVKSGVGLRFFGTLPSPDGPTNVYSDHNMWDCGHSYSQRMESSPADFAWLTSGKNAYAYSGSGAGSNSGQSVNNNQAFYESGAVPLSTYWSNTGEAVTSQVVTPTYVSTGINADTGSFMASLGLGSTPADFNNMHRNRPLRTWGTQYEGITLYDYYASQYQYSPLLTFSQETFDYAGVIIPGTDPPPGPPPPPPPPPATMRPQHNLTSTVVPTGSAVQIIPTPSGSNFGSLMTVIQNISANDVYIGPATVATSGANAGILLKGGLTIPDKVSLRIVGATWAIAVGGSATIVVDQVY